MLQTLLHEYLKMDRRHRCDHDFISKPFGNLTIQPLNWKLHPRFGALLRIDHLIVINKTYLPVMEQVRNNTYTLPWIGKIDFLVKFFGKTILSSVQPDRRKKMKIFRLWEPAKSEIGADIIQRFEKHQEQLKQFITNSSDLLDEQAIISSPANKNIVYKLETAFDIMVTHERRHYEQAKEVSALGFK